MRRFGIFSGLVFLTVTFFATGAGATPIRLLDGLASITIWEQTGAIRRFDFAPQASALTTRRNDRLSGANADFLGTSQEFYDVFYSNADGSFNGDGAYITVSAIYDVSAGTGLNLNEIALNFTDLTRVFGNVVSHFTALGATAAPESAVFAADGDIATATRLGHSFGSLERLSVTVGFLPSSGPIPAPEPGSLALMGFGLFGGALMLGRRRRV